MALAAMSVALLSSGLVRPGSAQEKPGLDIETVETRRAIPRLKAPAAYEPKDNQIVVELSTYPGYAGLIVANGGLDPSENSTFFRKHGFKVRLTLSEEESWSSLNSGRMAASATTVDVLTAYGEQFDVVVPAQIGFSRGADGVVVRKEIKQINDLRGKVLATAQFTEADFFIRYLASNAGLPINMLDGFQANPDPEKLNLVFCADGFASGDLFLKDITAGRNRLAGCVTWDPKTTEVAEKSEGKAFVLTTSKNLLIVADILIVNRGFARAHPNMVRGLVEGLIEGNSIVREQPEKYYDLIGKAFKWEPDETKAQMAKVHLANYPENIAFFNGTIDAAGSFGYIYYQAQNAYGPELTGKVPDMEHFLDLAHLKSLEGRADFQAQKTLIQPIRSLTTGHAEPADILFREISFRFRPNTSKLDLEVESNRKDLAYMADMLKVSPGSTLKLRGHADGSGVGQHREYGGQQAVTELMLELQKLSRDRCVELRDLLQSMYKIDSARIEVEGVGAKEPTGRGQKADRRVEVKWRTID
jgi:NitT/TauT family transport system substrate-binding protein